MKIFSLLPFCALSLAVVNLSIAQVQPVVSKVNTPETIENQPASIGVELSQNTDVRKVVLKYRSFGESEYKELEMLVAGRVATVALPAEVVRPPYVEFYIEVQFSNRKETYPLEGPDQNPLQLTVKQANPKDQEVRILSPEVGETVAAEDFVVAVSLYFSTDAVDRKRTKIYLDGVDVSKDAVLSDDVVLYNPRNFGNALNLGVHFVKVELYDTTGKLYHSREATFNLSTATAIAEEKARLRTVGNVQIEARKENLSSGSTDYLRGDVRLDGAYGILNFGSAIHLDNQERDYRQPQNRFLVFGETGFLRVQVGDAFPHFPSYIISGKRVRGISGNLVTGLFNVDATFGQTDRSIEGLIDSTDYTYPSLSAASGRPSNTIKTKNDSTFTFFTPGTYTRSIFAVRPSFGAGENFQLGFTYMKAKDDVSSIKYGILPKENLVIGTDLLIAFDDQRVKLETQASLGIRNNDISSGSFSQADYDSLKANNPSTGKDIENLGRIADKFITVNQNLFPTNPVGSGLPGVAGEAVLSVNYLNNYVRGTVYHRGAAYTSFGNEFLQSDLDGFLATDFIRLLNNRVFGSISFEQKSDNTANTKEVTTKFKNLNTTVTVSPGIVYPTFQIGFGQFTRLAGLDRPTHDAFQYRSDFDSTQAKSADELTTRFFTGASYDFEAGIRHTASLSFSVADRKDRTFKKQNQNNLFVQASLSSTFKTPLQTTLGVLYSKNRNDNMLFYGDSSLSHSPVQRLGQDSSLSSIDFNYTTITLGAQYRMLDDNLRLAATFSPSFGAFNRRNLSLAADYTVAMHNFIFQLDYIMNSGFIDETVFSLVYRYHF